MMSTYSPDNQSTYDRAIKENGLLDKIMISPRFASRKEELIIKLGDLSDEDLERLHGYFHGGNKKYKESVENTLGTTNDFIHEVISHKVDEGEIEKRGLVSELTTSIYRNDSTMKFLLVTTGTFPSNDDLAQNLSRLSLDDLKDFRKIVLKII